MSAKTIFSIMIPCLGLGIMLYAFLNNSSPYVTISEAKQMKGDHLHLAGDILRGSMQNDLEKHLFKFSLRDTNGDKIDVHYTGPPPSNMGSVNKVVAIGRYYQGYFEAKKLLIKCPSKYESAESLPSTGQKTAVNLFFRKSLALHKELELDTLF